MSDIKTSHKFWNKEYGEGGHLNLSFGPSNELAIFEKFLKKELGNDAFVGKVFLDTGCGNGRNAQALSDSYRLKGFGIDIADTAIAQAKEKDTKDMIEFTQGSIGDPLSYGHIPDGSIDLVIDMMSSHVLRHGERDAFKKELLRTSQPDAWFLCKTFLKDGDHHAARMISQSPAGDDEPSGYIHPAFGIFEHVWDERSFREFWEPEFRIVKVRRSHGHTSSRRGGKRRFMVVYMERVR